jgi:CxxC motif-containing protein (DUF1111 family)
LEAGQPSTALNIPDERSAASQKSNSTPQCRNLVDATRLSQRATEITRFGRKAQNKSLLIFSGEAYNVEMGVSNEAFPNERNTTPGCATNPTPEDTTNFTDPTPSSSPASDFSSDIINFAMYMRLLAAPTPASGTTAAATGTQVASNGPTAISAASTSTPTSTATTSTTAVSLGQQVFSNIGCSACHIPNQTTNFVGFSLDPTFNNKVVPAVQRLGRPHDGHGAR